MLSPSGFSSLFQAKETPPLAGPIQSGNANNRCRTRHAIVQGGDGLQCLPALVMQIDAQFLKLVVADCSLIGLATGLAARIRRFHLADPIIENVCPALLSLLAQTQRCLRFSNTRTCLHVAY
jgi:hypothetical protein